MTILLETNPLAGRSATHAIQSEKGSESASLYASMDALKLYRRQIPESQLDPAQLRHLARCIAEARDNSVPTQKTLEAMCWHTRSASEAKRQLIEANLRLVLHIARRYRGLGVDMMDLIQEGNLGLMHAVEKYDYQRGFAFSTYAMGWIRHYISRAIFEQTGTIARPLYIIEEIKRVDRARRTLEQQLTTEPTLEELAKAVGISVEEVVALLATPHEVLSLDQARGNGDEEATLRDTVADASTLTPEYLVEADLFVEHIRAALAYLPSFERQVIELRYGLDEHGFTQKEHTLVEAGKKLRRSHEAIRQAESRALRKLAALCQHLRVYLEA